MCLLFTASYPTLSLWLSLLHKGLQASVSIYRCRVFLGLPALASVWGSRPLLPSRGPGPCFHLGLPALAPHITSTSISVLYVSYPPLCPSSFVTASRCYTVAHGPDIYRGSRPSHSPQRLTAFAAPSAIFVFFHSMIPGPCLNYSGSTIALDVNFDCYAIGVYWLIHTTLTRIRGHEFIRNLYVYI